MCYFSRELFHKMFWNYDTFFEGGEGKLEVSHSLVGKGPLKL